MKGRQKADRPKRLAPPSADARAGDLAAVLDRLTQASSLDEIMKAVTGPVRAMLNAGGVTFVLREGDACHYAEEDAVAPMWKGQRFPIDACIPGWCMTQGDAIATRDMHSERRFADAAFPRPFARSLAMVPVPQQAPVGAIGAYWPEVRDVAERDLALLQTVANAAALAIANVELRGETAAKAEPTHQPAHRIKNLLAVVEALVNQTEAANVEDFRDALRGRVHALAQVHAEVFAAGQEVADLGLLVRTLLSPIAPDAMARVDAEGPEVAIARLSATDLALVFYELGANALRHGALSAPAGRVVVRWAVDGTALQLSWQESGGPAVGPPTRRGLGTRLINGIVSYHLAGIVELRYAPEGLYCAMSLPLEAIGPLRGAA